MSVRATRSDVERFRNAIAEQIGLQFEDVKFALLEELLQRRLKQGCTSTAGYLASLEQEAPPCELAALARELTVGETYFFRHNDQFRALAQAALPALMRGRESCKSLSLLSAGCASGEEAYSLAIVVREAIADPSWNVLIRAIDLNPAALQKAARARYSAWALREVAADIRDKWFRADHRELVLNEEVRRTVSFGEGNLARNDPALWRQGAYDVIFCRNVLMYFAPEQMRAAVARIAAALAPGGYLFLGHAETLRGISDDFHLCHSHDTFYYRRKEHLRPLRSDVHESAPLQTAHAGPPSSPPSSSAAWVDAIQQASARVAALVPAADGKRSPALQHPAPWQLAPALDLLRHERFDEALDHVRSGPPEAESDADVLLVKAVLLAQDDQLAAAEETCHRLLLLDGLNAGAHYVLALCREHAGEPARAMEHDRLAAHLDPAFAMPRLHCGLLARHAGDRDGARRQLAQALLLLKREDVARLLLFGGGFSRDALIALCQSAIAECGGRP